ncbi:hypothetical protein Q9R26_08245 [Curtobacterium sp. BRB10]|nr:hypothetical protein [Curtobacterium sp. BRB10]MDT0233397.1 hypothetical protein [Curtobacterium sp. BRB10]
MVEHLRHERVHQLGDHGACERASRKRSRGAETGQRRDDDVEPRGPAVSEPDDASGERTGEREHLDERVRPAVERDHRDVHRRVPSRRQPGEVQLLPVDLRLELRHGSQLVLGATPVERGPPVLEQAGQALHRQRAAGCRIADESRNARPLQTGVQVVEIGIGHLEADRAHVTDASGADRHRGEHHHDGVLPSRSSSPYAGHRARPTGLSSPP